MSKISSQVDNYSSCRQLVVDMGNLIIKNVDG